MLCTGSHDSHIESKTLWFIASHDAYSPFVLAYMTVTGFLYYLTAKLGSESNNLNFEVLYLAFANFSREGLSVVFTATKTE